MNFPSDISDIVYNNQIYCTLIDDNGYNYHKITENIYTITNNSLLLSIKSYNTEINIGDIFKLLNNKISMSINYCDVYGNILCKLHLIGFKIKNISDLIGFNYGANPDIKYVTIQFDYDEIKYESNDKKRTRLSKLTKLKNGKDIDVIKKDMIC